MKLHQWLGRRLALNKKAILLKLANDEIFVNDTLATGPHQSVDDFDTIRVVDQVLQVGIPKLYLAMHKPAGILSATKDELHTTVIDLIDHPHKNSLHLAGRLDRASTGLVILSNDGKWTQGITESTLKIEKEYLVGTAAPLKESDIIAFAQGFYFHTENITTLPAKLEILSDHLAKVILIEGRYHQIKRMFHRVQNRVTSIHRQRIGTLKLSSSMESGQWRHLHLDEIQSFRS